MRWWLGLTFAIIASLTAVAVAELFTVRAEDAFRGRARELAAGSAVAAAEAVRQTAARGDLDRTVADVAERRRLALFVFDAQGGLLTDARSHRVRLDAVPALSEALQSAVAGRRYLKSFDNGRQIVVALPLRTPSLGALVAYALRPELKAEVGIVHSEIVDAALLAVVVGAAVGLVVALLISSRLRRIARTAAAIESGSFDEKLEPRFHDELGELAATVDRMRVRLRESFSRLEEERDRLRRLLERLHEGVIAVDDDLGVEVANSAAARMLGTSRLRPGDPLPDGWPDLSLRRLAQGLFEDSAAIEARVPGADDRTYAVVGIPPGRSTQTAVLVLTDVSERERRERAEREFVANAAHELRTPVTAIVSAVEALKAGAADHPSDRDRFLDLVERQSTRLGTLTRALLVLARAQTRQELLRLEPVELRPVLAEAAESLEPEDGVAVEVVCPPGLAALGQVDVIEQIVANLCGNAARHTDEGKITLAAQPTDDDFVAIEITDTGSGIAPAARERIFDRFYSSGGEGREGFGLGLAIVRESVRALGGVIEVDSQRGVGTTARVTLARADGGRG